MSLLSEKIISSLENLGCRAKIVSISHINEMRDEILALRHSNMLDKKFYEDTLLTSSIDYDSEKALKNAKSIIIIAAPQSITKANFQYKDNTYSLTIPPIYVDGDIRSKVKQVMEEISSNNGFNVSAAKLPQKQLAVKSGLAKYGRNNISYIDEMGSFHLLMSYYTDVDLLVDSWQGAEIDSGCENCLVCLKNCPTGAISAKRFLIHGERCITNFNEYENDFPQWLKAQWHNSLIGCMCCQIKCPKNAAFVNKCNDIVAFTEEETKMLLDKVSLESLSEETLKKLQDISMISSYNFLSRNIKVLLRDEFIVNVAE